MPITLVGQAGTGGSGGSVSFPSPGPAISYSSTSGNTLIVAGQVESTSAITGISSIADDAGNTWQFATSDNQNPPSVVAHTTYYFATFIGWVIDAAPVTSVTITDSTGIADLWLVALSEWNSLSDGDNGVALTGTNANPTGVISLTFPDDLIVGSIDSSTIAPTALPPGWVGFRHVGSPRVYVGYAMPGNTGLYSAKFQMASDTYTLAIMSFYSTGDVAPVRPSMRAF